MKGFIGTVIFSLLASSTLLAQAQHVLGCIDCFNFTASVVAGAESITSPQMGLIVADSTYGGFRAVNSLGNWTRLSNDYYSRTLTGTTTLTAADDLALSNASSSAFSVNLPSAATFPGKVYSVKKTDSSTNAVTITPYSGQTIDGAASKALQYQNQVDVVVSDGSNWQDITPLRQVTTPTIQTLCASGCTHGSSGTYTLPSNPTPLYIRVRMVGGGGSGAGGGSTGSGSGSSASATTFGSILTANGGAGGTGGSATAGGAGGSASVSSPAVGISFTGAKGGSMSGGALNNAGASGGVSPFGGAGSGGAVGAAGAAAVANTGSGGAGGGGAPGNSSNGGGSGGGAGGYIDVIIPSPSSTYSYSVAGSVSGGTAGTSGGAGGAGASGLIEVTEYYQ